MNAPPTSSSSHPSLPLPYVNGISNHDINPPRTNGNGVTEWAHGQLEGPGMPVARNFPPLPPPDTGEGSVVGGAGDNDGEQDDGRTYCICDRVSYGEMIACDDENCEKEWVRGLCDFSYFGLTNAIPPFSFTALVPSAMYRVGDPARGKMVLRDMFCEEKRQETWEGWETKGRGRPRCCSYILVWYFGL